MNTQPKNEMAKMKTWIERFGAIALMLFVATGQALTLWLNAQYVTRAQLDVFANNNLKEHLTIATQIADVAATMKLMAQNAEQIRDHEARMRTVETRQTSVLERVAALERDTRELQMKKP